MALIPTLLALGVGVALGLRWGGSISNVAEWRPELWQLGLGGVSLGAQLIGTLTGVLWALLGGAVVYGTLRALVGIRLSHEDEFNGADLSIHRITATPEREVSW